jgi:hypothetical protein
MITNPLSTSLYKNKLCQFIQLIQQNDLKALKKAMKTKIGKNLKLVQSGILIAFQDGNCEALKILISSPLPDLFEDEINLLHCVVLTSKVEFLRILLSDKRIDINRLVGDSDGRTPLMVACTSGKVEMVQELLSHPKIDVNAQDENREWFALCYALHMGTPAMVQMLLSHKDISHSNIQESLLMGMLAVSLEELPIDLELLNILLKKNFENEFNLKNISNRRFEFHEHLQSWIAEEQEMKIREEYYNGNIDVTEESLCNKAFCVSFDVLQASILKCKCIQCSMVKETKRKMYWYGNVDSTDQLKALKGPDRKQRLYKSQISRSKLPKKTSEDKCVVRTKVFDKNRSIEVQCDFIASTLPINFKHILFHGGYETAINEIINGTKSVVELYEETMGKSFENNDTTEKICDKRNANQDNSNSSVVDKSDVVMDFDTLCWTCSATQVKLYKCAGCRKARYCSKQCIANDWEEHMSYCVKVQEKRNKKKFTSKDSMA